MSCPNTGPASGLDTRVGGRGLNIFLLLFIFIVVCVKKNFLLTGLEGFEGHPAPVGGRKEKNREREREKKRRKKERVVSQTYRHLPLFCPWGHIKKEKMEIILTVVGNYSCYEKRNTYLQGGILTHFSRAGFFREWVGGGEDL